MNKNRHAWATFCLMCTALLLLSTTFIACSESNDSENTENPVTPVNPEDYQTIPATGGTITKGDITIEFPSGTFTKDTKVAVTEVGKGKICNEDEVSKFYQVTMPLTSHKPLTVTIKCDKTGDDINAVINQPVIAYGKNGQWEDYSTTTIESTCDDGAYTLSLPAFDNSETTETVSFSLGMAQVMNIDADYNVTRAPKKVGNITWHFQLSRGQLLKNLEKGKFSDKVQNALTKLQNLGFKISGSRDIPISFKAMKDEEDGYFTQSKIKDSRSDITLNEKFITIADDEWLGKLEPTLIHELMHYYQAEYDPRYFPYVKAVTGGDEQSMYECAAVWVEKFARNGKPSDDFIMGYLPRFLWSMEGKYANETQNLTKQKSSDGKWYTNLGYGMSALLEYLTTKRKSEGFDDNSVVELYELWKKDQAYGWSVIPNATSDYIKAWVEQKNSRFFVGDNYDDFILKTLKGEVISKFNVDSLKDKAHFQDNKTLNKEDELVKFSGFSYPYGACIHRLTISLPEEFNKKGTLRRKQLVIKQEEEGVQTYAIAKNFKTKKEVFIDGKATKGNRLVIDGNTLESLRTDDNSKYHIYVYTVTTNRNNQTKLPATVTAILEEDYAVVKVKSIERASLKLHLHYKSENSLHVTDIGSPEAGYHGCLEEENPQITFSQDGFIVSVKSKVNYTVDDSKYYIYKYQGTLTFDIVGFGDLNDMVVENLRLEQNTSGSLHSNDFWKIGFKEADFAVELTNLKLKKGTVSATGTTNLHFETTVEKGLDVQEFKFNGVDWYGKNYVYTYVDAPDNYVELDITAETYE